MVDDFDIKDWRWPNFTPDEMRCKHTGRLFIVPTFMDRLQALRSRVLFALPVTSGFRDPSHPAEARKARPGAHAAGRAADIAISGERAFQLVAVAPAFGFTGIGVSQSLGVGKHFIHLDDEDSDYHAPRPTIWSY